MGNKATNVLQKVRKPFFTLLMLGVISTGLLLTGMPIRQTFVSAAPDKTVISEVQLIDAISDAPLIAPYVIELGANISLAPDTTITIPSGKNITLTGSFSLIGADGQPTITVEGTLTIDGITITHDATATGASRGVLVKSSGALYMNSGAIMGNKALGSFGFDSYGGGVFLSRDVSSPPTFTMTGGKISGNTASGFGGGVSSLAYFTMTGGEISGNTVSGSGGGVHNTSYFTMTGGKISGNTASSSGGGVLNSGAQNTFTMTEGEISGNTATGSGGGVRQSLGTLTMSGGIISNNTASLDGGGVCCSAIAQVSTCIFTMTGGTIFGNNLTYNDRFDSVTYAGSGGGVCAHGWTEFNMSGEAAISGNIARYGGGVRIGISDTAATTFNMTGGTISDNQAMTTMWEFFTTSLSGGGVYITSGSFFNISGGEISGNTVLRLGGGVFNNGTFVMADCTISGNSAHGGGGITNWFDSTFTMSGGTISNNSANTNGGGGIFNNGTFEMTAGEISNNTSAGEAGGVYNLPLGMFDMSGGTISNNTSTSNGGGVANIGFFTLSDNAVISCNEATNGGGIYCNYASVGAMAMSPGSIEMNGGQITGNSAIEKGGGVFILRGTFTMSGGNICDNTATNGGGIFNNLNITYSGSNPTPIYHVGQFEMQCGNISNNIATNNGGGLYNLGSFTMLENSVISGNKAINGGGIYIDTQRPPQTITINGGEISSNTASLDGGGIWISYDNLDKLSIDTGVIFSNNSAFTMYGLAENDLPLYNAQIKSNVWTVPFIYGYNNYDIYYATTSITNYTVSYLPGEHGDFAPQIFYDLKFGDPMPKPQSYPGYAGWRFAGWEPSLYTIVTGDFTFVAKWQQAHLPLSVTFIDFDGTQIRTEAVLYGNKVTTPANYVVGSTALRTGYTFTGWDGSYLCVTENLILTAQYIPTDNTKHLVIFQDWDGTFLKGEFVADRASATPPTTYVIGSSTLRDGYTFIGWDSSFTNVTSDTTAIALYKLPSNNNPSTIPIILGVVGAILSILAIGVCVFFVSRKKHNTQ